MGDGRKGFVSSVRSSCVSSPELSVSSADFLRIWLISLPFLYIVAREAPVTFCISVGENPALKR